MMASKMTSQGKVSVIVPVYNVENYLDRCIQSVLGQTYNNLEIMLVNDGSTDKSGDICERYAKVDPRIEVIHKDNGGLSDARNVGIDRATGDYINFLDSDDYIHQSMIETLMSLAKDYSAEIVTAGFQRVSEDEMCDSDHRTASVPGGYRVLNKEDALEAMLYQLGTTNSAWGKLYKRCLFDSNIRYPVGKLYEDLGTTYRLIANANKVVICEKSLYYYVNRRNSIMNSNFNPRRMEGMRFAIEQNIFIEENFSSISKASRNRVFAEAIFIAQSITKKGIKHHQGCWDECVRIMRQYGREVVLDSNANFMFRVYAFISMISPMLIFIMLNNMQHLRLFKKIVKKEKALM